MEKIEREDCDEIGNMTRFDKCCKPDNQKTYRDKEEKKWMTNEGSFLSHLRIKGSGVDEIYRMVMKLAKEWEIVKDNFFVGETKG